MVLPADFARLTVPEQLFVAIDRERVDRGLTPFAGLSTTLDAGAQRGAEAARLPPRPGPDYGAVTTEWIGDVDNGLDADFQWLYNDGPDSGVPGCSGHRTVGLLGRPQNRAGAPRDAPSRHGRRLRRHRGHVEPGRSGVLAGGDAGDLGAGHAGRLHLEGRAGSDVARATPTAAGCPLVGVHHRNPGPEPQRGPRARLHADLPERDRRLPGVHRRRAGGRQPRARARGHPADGAPGGIRDPELARSAVRRDQPRAGRPRPSCLRWPDGRARPQRPERGGRRQ